MKEQGEGVKGRRSGREIVMAAKSCGRAVRDMWSTGRGGEL